MQLKTAIYTDVDIYNYADKFKTFAHENQRLNEYTTEQELDQKAC